MLGSCLIILMSKGVVDVARVSQLVEQTLSLTEGRECSEDYLE